LAVSGGPAAHGDRIETTEQAIGALASSGIRQKMEESPNVYRTPAVLAMKALVMRPNQGVEVTHERS
jgi:hypothetical protein